MGLIVNLYRSDYDSTFNVFYGKKTVCVVNVGGPFKPTDDMPAAMLTKNACGDLVVKPEPTTRNEHDQA